MSTLCDPWMTEHKAPLSSTVSWSLIKNSGPLSWWCYLTISSSTTLFFFCIQSFPASGSFSMSSLLASDGQTFGASVSASVLLMKIQGWFPLRLTGLISLQPKGLSRVFSNTTVQKCHCLALSLLYGPTLISIHYYWKTITLTIRIFVIKVMSLIFNVLSRFIKLTFQEANILISWQESPSPWFWSPPKIKSVTASSFSPSICHEVTRQMSWYSFFECWISSQLFHSPLSPSSRSSLVPLHFLPLKWYLLHIWDC